MADLPRLTVALTFDHDSISDGVRRGDSPVKLSHAEFGVRVGAPRILALLAERGIPSTWFVPGHTLETFPDVDRGDPCRAATSSPATAGSTRTSRRWPRDEERELIERCAAAVERVTRRPAAGLAGAVLVARRVSRWS